MIRILKNPLTENYINLKNEVLGVDFSWYYYGTSTRSQYNSGEHFPFYMHTPLIKPINGEPSKINSACYDKCITVLAEIFDFNQIKVETLYRIAFNSSFHHPIRYGDPHVDHLFPHNNIIIYLNPDIKGSTFIFKEKFSKDYLESSFAYDNHSLQIEEEIKAEEDKVLIFDGFRFHTHGYTDPSKRRVILVATYS
jgi:hypothetical protein